MNVGDRKLLLRMHKGHEASARELWSRLAPRMLAYARSIVGRGEADGAEDVVQSVFTAVLAEPRSGINAVEDPAAWLLVLTRRGALNYLRSTRRDAARRRAAACVKREVLAIREPEDILSGAVGALPRRLREVVVLRHMAGLTFDQVAAALGANRNTTAARYREAIRRLRLMLADEGEVETGLLSAVSGSVS